MKDAKDKTPQKEVSTFRMGTQKKYKKTTKQGCIKTRLIRKEGGYGGFIKKYGKNPFFISNQEAKRLVGRNEECFCGSKKKYKRCCLNKE
tara:strand:- start:700 stop:969 length:270 start_codon:yes stop_codon:yes gene_type:complete